MRYVAAYLLSTLGGNDKPAIGDLQKVLGSVGIDCDQDKAKKVLESLKGKNLEDLLKQGREKLASVPSGGPAVAAAPVAAAAAEKPAEKESKKKKEESEEEEDEDMGFGLFD